jgi:mannosyltransferase
VAAPLSNLESALSWNSRCEERFWSIPSEARRWLLVLIALAAALRFFQIGQQSFWADEVFSLWIIPRGEDGLHHFFKGPLHAALLFLWSLWGGYGDAWTRSLSAVLGLATLPLLYLLGRRLGGHRVGLTAAFLLAVSPFHVWYSQEMRNYSLLMLVAVISQLCFLRLLDRGHRRDWILYGVTVVVALLTNFAGSFLPFGQGLYLLLRRRDLLARFVAAQALVALVLFPWLRGFDSGWSPEMAGKSAVLRGVNFHPMALPFSFSVFSVGFTVGPSLDEMNRALSLKLLVPHLWYFIPVAILYAWILVRGLIAIHHNREGQAFYTTWIAVPLLLVSVFAVLNVKVFNVRYMAVAFPGYLILLAEGICLSRSSRRNALLVLIAAACCVPLWNLYFVPRYWKPDARRAARYVESQVRPGDAVRVYSIPEPFQYYFHGESPAEVLPWDLLVRPENTRRLLDDLDRRYDRLWLVDYRGWYLDPENKLPGIVAERWKLVDVRPFVGVKVLLFAKRSPGE